VAAYLALPRSGPNYYAVPAAIAPNIMEKIEIKISSEYFFTDRGSNGLLSKKFF